MLAENTNAHPWGMGNSDSHATFIPSALLLLMAIDNGWEIAKSELVPCWENIGPAYLMTVRSTKDNREQKLVIPKSALVEKILEQHAPAMAPVC